MLGTASVASGVQTAVTVSAGVRGESTTYLTGTLSDLVRGVVLDPHRFAGGIGGLSRLAGLLCGAVLGASLLRAAPAWALALVVAVVVAALLGFAVYRRGAS